MEQTYHYPGEHSDVEALERPEILEINLDVVESEDIRLTKIVTKTLRLFAEQHQDAKITIGTRFIQSRDFGEPVEALLIALVGANEDQVNDILEKFSIDLDRNSLFHAGFDYSKRYLPMYRVENGLLIDVLSGDRILK